MANQPPLLSRLRERIVNTISCLATNFISKNHVEWVVNDGAELGIKIGNRFFWLYKGRSLVYENGKHDDGRPMYWRPVYKREFGECCHPPSLERLTDDYLNGDMKFELPTQGDW